MIERNVVMLALMLLHGASALAAGAVHTAPKSDSDSYGAWRASAAHSLIVRGDAQSLATAAALTFVGPAARTKTDSAKAAAAALDIAIKASVKAPDDPAIAWLRLQLCADAPPCDIRDAATTLRWLDADNGAAWLPTLAGAQKEKDTVQVDRVLADMAHGTRFDLYGNRTAVLMFDALKRARAQLPANYLNSDLSRLTEAMEIAGTAVMPSFSPLINACRETTASTERRDACLKLSKIMQRADAVMAQLVGFAIEKRLSTDPKELRAIAERRRVLEWRESEANISDTPLLPWLRNARARSRLAKMRAMPREEDVYTALVREHGLPLDPRGNTDDRFALLAHAERPQGGDFSEETAMPYRLVPVNIGAGEQFNPGFLAISPNNRMPAIVDHQPLDGGPPISVFESGAILLYLAEKSEQFLPLDIRGRTLVTEWLFWQVAGLGPMAGQNHHFARYAPEKIPYAIDRYVKETNRLYGVLNKRLSASEYIAGAYSIADMAAYPWVVPHEAQGQNLSDFPHLKRWFESIKARPATIRAYELAPTFNNNSALMSEEAKKILFGQTAKSVERP